MKNRLQKCVDQLIFSCITIKTANTNSPQETPSSPITLPSVVQEQTGVTPFSVHFSMQPPFPYLHAEIVFGGISHLRKSLGYAECNMRYVSLWYEYLGCMQQEYEKGPKT